MAGAAGAAKATVARWGNSTAVRLPKEVLREARMHEGDELVMEVEAPGVIRMRSTEALLTLEELLSGIKPGSLEEMDWGKPVGKEVW